MLPVVFFVQPASFSGNDTNQEKTDKIPFNQVCLECEHVSTLFELEVSLLHCVSQTASLESTKTQ